jgi:hypothetical protein
MIMIPALMFVRATMGVRWCSVARTGVRSRRSVVQSAAPPADFLLLRDRNDGIVATSDYVDETGVLLFQVVRKANKQFSQRRPDGSGGWIWKRDGTRSVPYRLPRVLEAAADGRCVYIAEGEKDVEALEAAGVVATCSWSTKGVRMCGLPSPWIVFQRWSSAIVTTMFG